MKTVSEFYDSLASNYDSMIDFEKRFLKEKPVVNSLVTRYNIRTAIDAGCGTGFHSLMLAWLGVKVTALDVSSEMILRLKEHVQEMNLQVETVVSDFQSLNENVHEKVDALFCLGNTLPHLLSHDNLVNALRNFKCLLNERGVLVIQLLNFHRIMKKRERIQNVKEREGKTFIRFYDFLDDAVSFNILTLERKENAIVHHLQSTPLKPIIYSELYNMLKEAGFNNIERYSHLLLEPFDEETSSDLVLVAR